MEGRRRSRRLFNAPRPRQRQLCQCTQHIHFTFDITQKFRVNGVDMGQSILLNRDEICSRPCTFFLPSALDFIGRRLYEFGYNDIYVANMLNDCLMKVTDIVRINNFKDEVIIIHINVEKWEDLDSDEEDEDVEAEAAMEESAPKPVPATTESILALERFDLGDFDGGDQVSTETCMVCLEELCKSPMKKPATIARMPCSHLFHEDCIVQWLNTSHFCPLCRFAMPTSSNQLSVMSPNQLIC